MTGPRRAGPRDAPAIRELTRAVYAKWVAVIGREPKPMGADYDVAVRHHWIDLLEDETGILALIEMIPTPEGLLIENLAVRAAAQGQGFAGLLLHHAENLARLNGMPMLLLYTNAAFAANLAYYAKRGFRETARTPLPDGGVMVHFAKAVS